MIKGTPGSDDIYKMVGKPRSDAPLEAALRSLLEQHPAAMVAAIGDDGIFMPWPSSLVLDGHHVLPGRSAMDFVVPGDWEPIIDAWSTTKERGAARVVVHLAATPDEDVDLYYFDLTADHGVYVGVLIGSHAREALARGIDLDDAPPRLARVVKNEAAVILSVDEATEQILGWASDELVGVRSLEMIHPDDQETAIRSWMTMLAARATGPRVRLRHRRRDGTWVWLEVTNHNLLDDPEQGIVAADMIDVTDEVAAHEALRRREQLFARLAAALPSGLVQLDRGGAVVYTNERLETILGIPAADTAAQQLATVVRGDWPLVEAAIDGALSTGADDDFEVAVLRPGERATRRCLVRVRSLSDDAGAAIGAIVSLEDVTDAAELRAALEERATTDMLTRCLNRTTVMSSLEGTLARGGEGFTAVIFTDLDEFKAVNDQYGHVVGDDVLGIAGQRLVGAVRSGDIVGRVGGDEFLVVCPDVTDPAEAERIAARVADALDADLQVGGHRITLHASVGVAIARRREATADVLVSEADTEMYRHKRAARRAGRRP
jgi:diguanylate cyclase (GGDEF)-like protein/PAS domain S-box-containing protein